MELETIYNSDFLKFINSDVNNIILFGASEFGKKTLNVLKENGKSVKCIFDNDKKKAGSTVNGIIVKNIDELSNIDRSENILIASSYYYAIYLQLSKLGFSNIFYFSDKEIASTGEYLNIVKHKSEINKLMSIVEDELSKKVLLNVIMARITGNIAYIDKIIDRNEYNEYFDKSIVKLKSDEVFVDAGSYSGDTILKFIDVTQGKFDKIYAFEPGKNNFKLLKSQFDRDMLIYNKSGIMQSVDISNVKEKLDLNNLGIYDKKTTLNFQDDLLMGSHISNKSNNSIDVIKLDNFIGDKKVTFIKMDIEGSEMEGLYGSKNIITSQKPKLAICIYHKPNDLWELPLFIKELVKGYRLYIRHYDLSLMDTVCYAIPK